MKKILLIMCVVVAQLEAVVSNGSLDTSFNPTPPHTFPGAPGVETIFSLTQNFGAGATSALAFAVALQANGNIVAAGISAVASGQSMAIVRLNGSNGSLDSSFNPGVTLPGKQGVESIPIASFDTGANVAEANAVAIQSDGKIVLGGFANPTAANGANAAWSIVRLNTDGSLDTSFNALPSQFPGSPGIESIPTSYFQAPAGAGSDIINSIALQGDGKIILVGQAFSSSGAHGNTGVSFGIGRLTTTGGLDTSFNPINTFAGMPGVEVLFSSSFGAGFTSAEAFSVVIQPNGNIVVAGEATNAGHQFMAVVRLTTTGGLDPVFNAAGFTPGMYAVPLATFGLGTSSAEAFSVALQSDGKILIAGTANPTAAGGPSFAIARLNTDGSVDGTFNAGGTPGAFVIPLADFGGSIGATDANVASVQVQSDGGIVLGGVVIDSGGVSHMAVARLTSAGVLDPTFNPGGALFPGVPGVETFPLSTFEAATTSGVQANAMVIDPLNNIILAGDADPQSQQSFAFARLFANSQPTPPGPSGPISPIAAAIIAKYC